MIYLLLAIISSGMIALIFKYNESNNVNRLVVTTGNYFAAFFISAFMIYQKGGRILQINNFNMIILGIISGFIYFYTFIIYQKNIKNYGASITGVFMKLGVFFPMLLSMFIWREYPSYFQIIGLIGAILAIVIINYNEKVNFFKDMKFMLLILFLAGGLCDFVIKIFQKYGDIDYKENFLLLLFLSSFTFSCFYSIKKVKAIKKKDILLGIAVGIPNLFSSFFLILALDTISGPIAFSFYSVGSLIFIIIGSYFLFQEKIKKKDISAIILTLLSLTLINMKI